MIDVADFLDDFLVVVVAARLAVEQSLVRERLRAGFRAPVRRRGGVGGAQRLRCRFSG
jgi:hypothetical protein